MWNWVFGLCAVALLLSFLDEVLRRNRARRNATEAIQTFRTAGAGDSQAALAALTRQTPESALAWYLLGVVQLRAGRIHEAARSFGMAHHRDCDLETAALLTFACLKAREGDDSDLVEQLITTWGEMRKPDLVGSASDRLAMDCIADADSDNTLSPLGRLAWSIGDGNVRTRITDTLRSGAPESQTLRAAGHR